MTKIRKVKFGDLTPAQEDLILEEEMERLRNKKTILD